MIRRTSIANMNGALFSDCEQYRYLLWRRWHYDAVTCKWLNVLLLNPSTATETEDDPTISRCITRAQRLGFGGLYVTNIFAWRSTDPKVLYDLPQDPIGPDNDTVILETAKLASMVICGWGNHGQLNHRADAVREILSGIPLHALKVSEKTGMPIHPLYQPFSLEPVPYV